MARVVDVTAEQEKAWGEWVASRPPAVRALAERFDPWSLYRLKPTGSRVQVVSFSEDGTLKVAVLARFNKVLFERQVFGIKPEDLEPCDMPPVDEPVGALLTQEEVGDNIDLLRCAIRPDLFVMDDNGKAVRREGRVS